MSHTIHSTISGSIAIFAIASLALVGPALASSYRPLHDFGPPPDGDLPTAGVVADNLGRLYGMAPQGGTSGQGIVYRLTPPATTGGAWTEEILHSFNGFDGSTPNGRLLLGPAGEIYGTTLGSGALPGGQFGNGTVFRLDETSGGWTLTTLHVFQSDGSSDGVAPVAGLVFGPGGLLYGTTVLGGGTGVDGTAYSISPLGDAVEYQIIHRFGAAGDGQDPDQPLLPVGSDFVGTTSQGPGGGGTVFRLSQGTDGQWREKVLHLFGGAGDFAGPDSSVVQGAEGTLYGCAYGGTLGAGGMYSLSHADTGETLPVEAILYQFGSKADDPIVQSLCGVVMGPNNTLYGTTDEGGSLAGGTFFSLLAPASGQGLWAETNLHNFPHKRAAGSFPAGAPLRRGATYYGVTMLTSGLDTTSGGTVYRFTP